jgi:hypothetical protein
MERFDDLLNAADYDQAVAALALDFRTRHELPPLGQLGLVVANAEQAAAGLEARGVPPFMLLKGAAKQWRERGRDVPFSGSMGLTGYRGVELELLEPGVGSDFYGRFLDPAGGTTVQHLGFFVDDVDAWAERIVAGTNGRAPLWVRGRLEVGPNSIDFSYVDAIGECGFVIEFISWRLLGRKCPGWRCPFVLERSIGRLQKTIGVRTFSA